MGSGLSLGFALGTLKCKNIETTILLGSRSEGFGMIQNQMEKKWQMTWPWQACSYRRAYKDYPENYQYNLAEGLHQSVGFYLLLRGLG